MSQIQYHKIEYSNKQCILRIEQNAASTSSAPIVKTANQIMPYAPETFDQVICQNSLRYVSDTFSMVCDLARCLKSGGQMVVIDYLLPDEERAAEYINAFEALRDPAYQQAFAGYNWEGLLLDAGLLIENSDTYVTVRNPLEMPHRIPSRQLIQHLQILLAQAPEAVRDYWQPQTPESENASITQQIITLRANKPAD